MDYNLSDKMDMDVIINSWINTALTEVSMDTAHHFNITYGLYLDILTVIEEKGLNIQDTMSKVLKLIHPDVELPSSISYLTQKVKKYKGPSNTTIQCILPQPKVEYLGDSCKEAGLKICDLHDPKSTNRVRQEHTTNGLIYELEKYR